MVRGDVLCLARAHAPRTNPENVYANGVRLFVELGLVLGVERKGSLRLIASLG